VEQSVGRRFDLVYNYHDIDDAIPTETEVEESRQGRTLHVAIAARLYGDSSDSVTYADIADGQFDADLARQAAGVASLRVPVFMTFEQEANQHDKLGARGTSADFRAAWRHIHDVYVQAGATNAVWVWVMTGSPDNLSRAGELWPGNDVVDWISWNVYNQSGCGSGSVTSSQFTSFEEAMSPFYEWVRTQGPGLGIDPDKPMMISETGSVTYVDDPARTALWYASIPSTLEKYPQVKAVTLWDSKTSDACDYTFQQEPPVLAAVAGAGLDPIVTGPSG
jgi:beta-mannanase